jgi:hypothetical protein
MNFLWFLIKYKKNRKEKEINHRSTFVNLHHCVYVFFFLLQMQAVTPVDVHVENDWREGANVKQNTKISSRKDRQASRMRTRVLNKTKTKKINVSSSPIPKQVVIPKLVPPIRSRSPSPNRGPW